MITPGRFIVFEGGPKGGKATSLGFGVQSGGFVFDIAGTFGGLTAENGQTPVYVSLRYLF